MTRRHGPHTSFRKTGLILLLAAAYFALTHFAAQARATETLQCSFDLPADVAGNSLKKFAGQSGKEVVFASATAGQVRTNAVKGSYTPRDALNRMVANTALSVVEDVKTGALMIHCARNLKEPAPPASQSNRNDENQKKNDMKTRNPLALLLSGLFAFAGAPTDSVRAAASPSPSQASSSTDQMVTLSPFEVQADKDNSYGALNSNSITRFNTELVKLPISADIYDATFMKDVAANTVEAMIQTFSSGAGYSGADAGSAAANQTPGDRYGVGYMTLRGFQTPSILRDAFMPAGSIGNPGSTGTGITSNFDLERVEIIQGPQALLYGQGGAGGVINIVSKQARLGAPAAGELSFRVDQYGTKNGMFDYGFGNDRVAVRVALINNTIASRRVNIGGKMQGYYGQFALRLLNTTVRLTAEQTIFKRIFNSKATLTALSTANDARNGQLLTYILATNQVNAAANGGASGAGPILNGNLNWSNVNSFTGEWQQEFTQNQFCNLTADSKWSGWLSTQLAVGYDDYANFWTNQTPKILAPNAAGGIPGTWSGAISPVNTRPGPAFTRGFRFTTMLDNHFFGNRVHSQTVVGIDNIFTAAGQQAKQYYLADSGFNPVFNPATTTNNGRTAMPSISWLINNGPVFYPLPFRPRNTGVTLNGVNYVLMPKNLNSAALVSPTNPLGVTLGGQAFSATHLTNKGIFGVNYAHWLEGRIDTLVGFRAANTISAVTDAGDAPPLPPNTYREIKSSNVSFNAGLTYHLSPLLHPYFSVSDSFNPPSSVSTDPYGNPSLVAHGLSEEVGLKFNNKDKSLSGAIIAFHTLSTNERITVSGAIVTEVNPAGLNGQWNSPGSSVNVNRESAGVQLQLTASPTKHWRIRISAAEIAGKIGSTVNWGQLYNDQFYQNSAGSVTYANGNAVYVNSTYNAKQLTVAPTTAGAIPLTAALMNNPTSVYFANPISVNGQINPTSAVWNVLKNGTDPATPGSGMLTGAVGLPISKAQINVSTNPTVAGYVPPPGVITGTNTGDLTTGYPKWSFNFTNSYSFDQGLLKGLQIGGSARVFGRLATYYYYVNGVSPTSPRIPFYMPNATLFDLLLGYTRKFKRVTYHAQLNVSNLLNHYQVVLLPGQFTGYTPTGSDAAFNTEPRAFTLTNRLSF